ncbi:hypothetical protein HNP46_006093 [Pseudomonas nitritireducens]|uniref:Uncharacterized protein n=1 Tax=Pseudomonas nitroreducens TaxID=46680 RepID=A0A7W7KQS6_PSENT|nr:hypothetical protein [Pseudomonas nitritireducens]MBB4867182.1 hypothetical protein [Pseudomonas nitritireducens]
MTDVFIPGLKVSYSDKLIAAICKDCKGILIALVTSYVTDEDDRELLMLHAEGHRVKRIQPLNSHHYETCYCAGTDGYAISKAEEDKIKRRLAAKLAESAERVPAEKGRSTAALKKGLRRRHS